jgi:peptidoglycan/xylan/chitin deacetylase (PgdA/CDA1 family)
MISVVVPAYNEEKFIGECLSSLRKQNYKGAIELIVVDNASTDKTVAIARKFGAKVVYQPKKGVVLARQSGFDKTSGDIIASTDADTIVPANWIENIEAPFAKNKGLIGLSGPVWPKNGTLPERFLALFVCFFFYLSSFFKLGFFAGANFAVRKSAFEKVGGFDKSKISGEDTDLCKRLQKFGKVKFLFSVKAATSMRGLRKVGIVRFGYYHLINFLNVNFLNKPPRHFSDIREELKKPLVSRRLLVSLILLAAIVALFYFALSPRATEFGPVISQVKTNEKIVALTFDDGPNEPYTSEIIAILNQYQIKATFFVVGKNVEYYPETAKKIIASGDIIGNHSYDHKQSPVLDDPYYHEVDFAQAAIYKVVGVKPRFFRPPYGFKSPWQLRHVRSRGLIVVDWNDDGLDYRRKSPEQIAQRAISKAKPGGIILLHDGDGIKHGANRSKTVQALPIIISTLRSQGYRFVTIPELVGKSAYLN